MGSLFLSFCILNIYIEHPQVDGRSRTHLLVLYFFSDLETEK